MAALKWLDRNSNLTMLIGVVNLAKAKPKEKKDTQVKLSEMKKIQVNLNLVNRFN